MPKLTMRDVQAFRPALKDYFKWCSATPGFGVRVYPNGRRIFVVQTRVNGRTRRVTLGPFGPLTVEQARARANEVVRLASKGVDPQLERKTARDAPTVEKICTAYLEAADAGLVITRFKRPKRASTLAIDHGRIARHIVPLIGTTRARDLTRGDVQRMVDQIGSGKTAGTFKGRKLRGKAVVLGGVGTAARVKELLGGILSWAEDRGMVPGPNAVRRVVTARGEAKNRTLSQDELKSLGEAIERARVTSPMAASALTLIALTGLRCSEACGLKWREIDEEGRFLRLPVTKTGRSTRPTGARAFELLKSLPRLSDEFCFPNRTGKGSADLDKRIAAIFDDAGLADGLARHGRSSLRQGNTAAGRAPLPCVCSCADVSSKQCHEAPSIPCAPHSCRLVLLPTSNAPPGFRRARRNRST